MGQLLRGALVYTGALALLAAVGCGGVGVPSAKGGTTAGASAPTAPAAPAAQPATQASPAAQGSPAAAVVNVPPIRLVSSDGSTPGPNDGNTTGFDRFFLDELTRRSGGAITWDKNWGGSLLTYTTAPQGTREGIADIASIAYNFHPAFFPLTNVVLDVNTVMDDLYAGMQAASELIETNPHIQAEWEAAGLKPIPTAGTPWAPKGILCREPIPTVEGFQGKRTRVTSEADSAIMVALGASPVRMDTTEVYEALERGAIDCVLTSAAAARSQKWAEPSKWFLVSPELAIFSCCYRAMNLSKWNALPAETQQLIRDVAEDSWVPVGEIILNTDVEAVFDYAESEGVEVVRSWPEAAPVINQASQANREAWLQRMAAAGKSQEAQEVLADWERIAQKWNDQVKAEGYPWE